MALVESSYLKQIEIAINPKGEVYHIFAEYINTIERDNIVIAQSNHRASFPADSQEGKTILGEALSSALTMAQQASLKIQEMQTTIGNLNEQINQLQSKVSQGA